MFMKKFTGTGVAIVTPFNDDLSIDFQSLKKLVSHLITNNVNYLVVLGTTGESVTLTKEEKKQVIDAVIKENKSRLPIVVGLGGNNTNELVNTIKATNFDGIDAILSVAPYYNKPQQEGIYLHYKLIAENSPVPVILYNVQGRTSVNINAETSLRLAKDFKNIVAIKEASGNFNQIACILKDKPEDFSVISGDDDLTLPLMAMGVDGVISVTANALPFQYSKMVNFCLSGNFEEAKKIHFELLPFFELFFKEGNPAGIKAGLNILNMIKNNLRLPLTKISNETYSSLSIILKNNEKRIN